MSDGDGKDSVKFLNEKESQHSKRKKKKLGSDEFAQAIARIAVAQVCESLGFQSFHQSALDNLADIGVRYIREIGKTACSYANLANRSECNVFDVIQGLEDLSFAQGFSGASDVNHALSGSGVVKDIIRYVAQAEEISFAYSVPSFPVVRERKLDHSFAQAEENPPDEHIPSWLPKFPDPETYTDLSLGNEKDSEMAVVNKFQQTEEQDKKVVNPSLPLQQKLICNGSEAGVVVEPRDAAKAQRLAENNPFLAPPFQFGEKVVSVPVIPAKLLNEAVGYHEGCDAMENHLLTLEPALQVKEASRRGPCEPEGRRKILLNGRPDVTFKIGHRKIKKSLGLLRSPRNEGMEKLCLWFGDGYDDNDDDGNEEKKRKAEKILWENTEHRLEEEEEDDDDDDDGNDEKKQRGEKILWENTENPPEGDDDDGNDEKKQRGEKILWKNTEHPQEGDDDDGDDDDGNDEKKRRAEKMLWESTVHSPEADDDDDDGNDEKKQRAEKMLWENTEHPLEDDDGNDEKRQKAEKMLWENTGHRLEDDEGNDEKRQRGEKIIWEKTEHPPDEDDQNDEKRQRAEKILLENKVHPPDEDDGKDDKRQRAEKILWENAEHPPEEDDGDDEKKQRAENILSENTDHPQEEEVVDGNDEKKRTDEKILCENIEHPPEDNDDDGNDEKKERAEKILSENTEHAPEASNL